MNPIQQLLEDLNKKVAITGGFRRDLKPMMKAKEFGHGKIFIGIGDLVKKAWQLTEGYIVAERIDENGNITVMKVCTRI